MREWEWGVSIDYKNHTYLYKREWENEREWEWGVSID